MNYFSIFFNDLSVNYGLIYQIIIFPFRYSENGCQDIIYVLFGVFTFL